MPTTTKKHSKKDALYVPKATKKQCKDCHHFDPQGACDLVSGSIDPGASCRYFDAKKKGSK